MSRIYDALCELGLDREIVGPHLEPNSVPAAPETASAVVNREGAFTEDGIVSFRPLLRESSRLVAMAQANSLGAEKFHLLRDRLRHQRRTRPLKKIVITSAIPGEGKTLVSVNLAISLAQHTAEKVLLLEGDLRQPTFADCLGMEDFPGLGNWFASPDSASRFTYRVDESQLWVLPVGSVPENPDDILQSARFRVLYEQLSSSFDWLIIDAPPLLPMADVSFWSHDADGLLLVIREGMTPGKVLAKGLETLDSPKLIGIVLNDAQGVESSYYDHYYAERPRPPAKAA